MMFRKTWRITGQLVEIDDQQIEQPVPGLGVEVLDEDAYTVKLRGQPPREIVSRYGSEILGYTVSDSSGKFYFSFTEDDFQDTGATKEPRVFFRVFNTANDLIKNTIDEPTSLSIGVPERLNVKLIVTPMIPIEDDLYSVSGTATYSDGTVLSNLFVRAYDQVFDDVNRVFKEVPLGSAQLSGLKTYRINYSKSLIGTGKSLADIIVKITDRTGDQVVATSKMVANAPRHCTINVYAPKGTVEDDDEFTYLSGRCAVLDLVDPKTVGENQAVSFANRERLTPRQITYYVQARHLESKFISDGMSMMSSNTGGGRVRIPAAFFYGLFRQRLPLDLNSLAKVDENTLTEAIQFSAKEGIVSEFSAVQISTYVGLLKTYSAQDLVSGDSLASTTHLRSLMDAAALPDDNKRVQFVDKHIRFQGDPSKFWDQLPLSTDITEEQAKRLKLAVQCSSLANNYVGTVTKILAASSVEKIEDVAGYNLADWQDLIDGDFPTAEFASADDFARHLKQRMEEFHPYASFRGGMYHASTGYGFGHFKDFLDTVAASELTFDLGETNVLKLAKENPSLFTNEQIKDAIKTQSLYRIAPASGRFDTAKALHTAGIKSAFDISMMGESAFQKKVSGFATESEARSLYRKSRNAAAQAIFIGAANIANAIPTRVLPTGTTDSGTLDYDKLFGQMDQGEVDHDRSVFGPLAYLVDCLEYLRRTETIEPDGIGDGFKRLIARRPDIIGTLDSEGVPLGDGIKLTIHNTKTSMPYIDLVNEVLEGAVADAADITVTIPSDSPQTTLETADLKAYPEHLIPDVYNFLAGQIYPWNFDLWREEAAAYPKMLSCPRHEVMELFSHDPPGSTCVPPIDVACEKLGMTRVEYNSISDPAQTLASMYAVPAGEMPDLDKVEEYLKAAIASYDELLELLENDYVNPVLTYEGTDYKVEISYPDADLTSAVFVYPINATGFNKVHFFKRLYRFRLLKRKTGWSTDDLGDLLQILGISGLELTGVDVLSLAKAKELEQTLQVKVTELTKWWGHTFPMESFLKKFRLTSDTLALWRAILSPNPFKPSDSTYAVPADTELFIEQYKAFNDAGFKADQVLYLNVLDGSEQFADFPEQDVIVELLREYQKEVLQIYANYPALDDTGSAPLEKLAPKTDFITALWKSWISDKETVEQDQLVKEAMEILLWTSTKTKTEQQAFFDTYCSEFLDPQDAAELTYDTPPSPPPTLEMYQARFSMFLNFMAANAATQLTASKFKTTAKAARYLLRNCITVATVPEPTTGLKFLAYGLVYLTELQPRDIDTVYIDFEETFKKLFKIGVIAGGVEVTEQMVRHFTSYFEETKYETYKLLEMIEIDSLNKEIQGPEGGIYDLIDVGATEQSKLLASLIGWSSGDIDAIVAVFDGTLSWIDPELTRKIVDLHKYALAIDGGSGELLFIRNLDVNYEIASAIWNYVKTKMSLDDWYAKAPEVRAPIRQGQRSVLQTYLMAKLPLKFTDVNDLYEHYLIDSQMEPCFMTSRVVLAISATQLFIQRALMGFEKDPTDIVFSRSLKEEWKWRKNYRVWEANRKVFLYPENWIEPELRDDKTPFFKELEDELLQGEVTDENVEKALLNYLYKVDEVSCLDVRGMCKEYDKDNKDTETTNTKERFHNYEYVTDYKLHLFARTREAAPKYFYRIWDAGIWKPWEPVELDISGDHLIPIIYNRKLHLFWPEFIKTSEATGSGEDTEIIEYWKLQVSWSVLQEGKWSKPRQAINSIKLEDYEEVFAAEHFFKAAVEPSTNKLYLFHFQAWADWTGNYEMMGDDSGVLPSDVITTIDQAINGLHEFGASFKTVKLKNGFVMNGYVGELVPWENETGTEIPKLSLPITTPHRSEIEKQKYVTKHQDQYEWTNEWAPPPDPNSPQAKSLSMFEKAGPGTFVDGDEYLQSFFSPFNFQKGDILRTTERNSRVTAPNTDPFFLAESPFTFEDSEHCFFIVPTDAFTTAGYIASRAAEFTSVSKLELKFTGGAVTKTALVNHLTAGNLAYNLKDGSKYLVSSERRLPAFLKYKNSKEESLAVFTNKMSKRVGAALSHPQFDVIADSYKQLVYQPSYWKCKTYTFGNFYHPHTARFIKQIQRYGVEGLLNPGDGDPSDVIDKYLVRQGAVNNGPEYFEEQFFEDKYEPWQEKITGEYPRDNVDFSLIGPNSVYNWEIFFHVPLLIAARLTQDQKFEQANRWYQFIFDPTAKDEKPGPETPSERGFWKTRPFYEHCSVMGEEITKYVDEETDLALLIKQWQENPFSPHLIARFRKVAYMKTVVMKYIDNLIAWGDMLFRRDTMESINEATQYYILAAQILGKQPVLAKKDEAEEVALDYQEIRKDFEGLLTTYGTSDAIVSEQINVLTSMILFGGLPKNDKLKSYWDTVADRLFKIRNCMNIEGVVRSLDLFAPPIDPALLVRAAAAGLDFGEVLNDLASPSPIYRFTTLLAKAVEFSADVKTLGGALLSTLEKKDVSELEMLRASQETALNETLVQIRQQNIDEAKETLESLNRSKTLAEARRDYYHGLVSGGLSYEESQFLKKSQSAQDAQNEASNNEQMASIVNFIPDITLTTGAMPSAGTTIGGSFIGAVFSAKAAKKRYISGKRSFEASQAQAKATFSRRSQDWNFQHSLALKEIPQIEKQIVAQEIRAAIAENELDNLKQQIERNKEVEDYLKSRYTNKQLYSWMIGKISGVYFQAYKLAYDMARKAEKAYKAEILDDTNGYIKFDNWDSLHKGLLAGEKLHNDLKRLDVAYLEKNKRRQEVRKSLSLAQLDPSALMSLRSTGSCNINLPEIAFDIDYPGQYERRIKTISLSIPCVAGPNTSISAKLSLTRNIIRLAKPSSFDPDTYYTYDPSLLDCLVNWGGSSSIATSNAQNDVGMFELNFSDQRYLPFEGSGVISKWTLDLPHAAKQFNYQTISDVIINVSYTSKEDGLFRTNLETGLLGDEGLLNAWIETGFGDPSARLKLLVSLKQNFPAELQTLKSGTGINITITKEMFPYFIASLVTDLETPSSSVWVETPDGGCSETTVTLTNTELTVAIPAADAFEGASDVLLVLGFLVEFEP